MTGKLISRGSLPPGLSHSTFKSLSDQRQQQIIGDIQKGKWGAVEGENSSVSSNLGFVVKGSSRGGINKKGGFDSGGHSSSSSHAHGWRGSADTVGQLSELYSPLLLHSNLNLPRDRATINAWCRSFFALNPYAQNAIALHSTYPISEMTIKCKNKKVEEFFANMIEEIDLINICTQIAQEYWTVGEAIVYADLDEYKRKWTSLTIQNPDYVDIKNSIVPGQSLISLRPDENLKRICNSNKPADILQRQQLSPHVIEHVRRGENIPLNTDRVSHLARRISPYETRGTGLIVPAFRSLMLFDKIRECKFAQTESMINPMTIIKIGGAEHKPNYEDLVLWRDVWEQATTDKDFKIFTHNEFTVERNGAGAAIYDTTNDIAALIKEIYIALMVPSVLMDGGSDTSYANGSVALDVLKSRYLNFRQVLKRWLRQKIFYPIAVMNDFFEFKDNDKSKEKVVIIPDIDFNAMSLFDTDSYIAQLSGLVETNKVPKHTLYRSLGLDYEEVQAKLREEAIDNAIMEKEAQSLAGMKLLDLRALAASGKEIPETKNSEMPGENANMADGGPPGSGDEMGGPLLPGVQPLPSAPPPGGPPPQG